MHDPTRAEVKAWFREVKAACACAVCDTTTNIEFHHVDPRIKKANISHLVRKGAPFSVLLSELWKCIPVCGFCHRAIHDGVYAGWMYPDTEKVRQESFYALVEATPLLRRKTFSSHGTPVLQSPHP